MPDRPERRLAYDIVLSGSEEVVASGVADQFGFGLAGNGIGDGAHAFWTRLARPLDAAERASAVVRVECAHDLPRSPHLTEAHEPLLHVAMDIVDNCNLRCPFCLYDYEHTRTTHFMTDETLDAALRFLPYAKDGEFWFSCLHEPTLHPRFVDFVERVPADYRRKLFYTTNLAKRMPASYFDWVASNGAHHINISIESRDPALYERMRKGARHRIFQENWETLMGALARAESPTKIRYIVMAYKANLRELPGLARHLLDERRAWQVEIRYTFDVPHIDAAFKAQEFLDDADWDWLEAELAPLPADRVQLHRAPRQASVAGAAPAMEPAHADASSAQDVIPGRAMFRLSWDGTLKVVGVLAASRNDVAIEKAILQTNIREIADPEAFFRTVETLAPAA